MFVQPILASAAWHFICSPRTWSINGSYIPRCTGVKFSLF